MRLLTLTLLLSLTVAMPLFAQDDQIDDLNFEEAQISEETVPYFAIGVGFVASANFLPTDDVNARCKALGLDDIGSPMFVLGGEAFSAIGFIPNVRAGFSWTGGSRQASKDTTLDQVNVKRALEYHVTLYTVHVDYAFVLAKGLSLLPGLGFGVGSQAMKQYQSVNDRTWSDYNGMATPPDMYSFLDRAVYYVPARLNLEYAITPFVAVRGQAAYTYQVGSGNWLGNHVATVGGAPDGLTVNAFSAQVGLFVGLFN
jgi:hypothetical protein